MHPVAMACDTCQVEVRGPFRQALFSQLPAEDIAFLERYLLAGFSIKALAEESGMGYVAIRNRLDRLLASYGRLRNNEDAKRAILEKLEKGELTAEEAVKAMERL
jgi:hypothetical protein